MNKGFSIYGNASKSFPAAASEHLIQIALKDQAGKSSVGAVNYGTIMGYMTSEFTYSSQGNYANIYDISLGNMQVLKMLQDETQRNFFNYGYATKKMYANGPSPAVSVEFRCYAGTNESYTCYCDKNGNDTNPVTVANALINATLPRVASDSYFNNTNLEEQLTDGSKSAMAGVGGMIYGTASLAVDGFKAVGALVGLADGDDVVKEIQKDKAQITKSADKLTSKKPPICLVKIGNIFEKDYMVVKTVEVKFSKEYMSKGVPLYADFSVTLESLFNSSVIEGDDPALENIFGSGLNGSNNRKSRVTFT